jgi:hypothetical protein
VTRFGHGKPLPATGPCYRPALSAAGRSADGFDCHGSPGQAVSLPPGRAAGKAIPFFGLLLNLASLGNPTWIFEGQPEALEAGCRQADLLFIDSTLADRLTTTQIDAAARVMQSANIVVYHRETRQMAFLHIVSGSQDKMEFRDA